MCMDLEMIILSEVSQTEKDKYCMISLMWNLKYNTNKLFKKHTHRQRKQTYVFQRKSVLNIHSWRTDAEAEAPILWPLDVKNWLIGKDPDAGKDWRQEEKGVTEDGMVGWHHQLDGHEFEQAPGAGDGQGSLACCSPWGRRVGHDWATELNWCFPKGKAEADWGRLNWEFGISRHRLLYIKYKQQGPTV